MSSICRTFQCGRRALVNRHVSMRNRTSRRSDLFMLRRSLITVSLINSHVNTDYPCRVAGDDTKSRFLSMTNNADLAELNKSLLECADRGVASQADDILTNMETQALSEHAFKMDVDSYTAVLDAWLQHQENAQENMEGEARIQEMHHAAERANHVLTRMENDATSASIRPTSHHYDAVLKAWCQVCVVGGASKRTKGAPQRAKHVLEQMETKSLEPSSGVVPTVESYNRVMEAWGTSGEHLRASMAQAIYKKLVASPLEIEPNHHTFRIMMRAWCTSKQKRAAFNATGHLMKMQEELKAGIEEMEPTIEDYHMVLEAWTRAEGKLGYRRATSILRLMDDLYISRATEVRPDETCYRLVLQAVAHNSVTVPDLGQWIDTLLNQMEERLMIPDTACFGAAIETFRNSAVLAEETSSSLSAHQDAKRAHELLQQMKATFHRTSTIVVKPCTQHFNMVIKAWSMSSQDGAAKNAEALLLEMTSAGDEDMKPDSDSYIRTMDALARSKAVDKVERALTVFQRLKAQHDEETKPLVGACNAMMSVCASATNADAANRKAALQTAFSTMSELTKTKEGDGPNSTTYRIVLEACANLLPPGKEQLRALKRVFENCCRAGLVDKDVLETFKNVAPTDLYNKQVVAAGVEDDSGKMVPEEWTRNLGYRNRVLTVEGYKPPPLSIEGLFVFTPAMYENKMRNLRKRKNQRLLRAGRMRR